MKGLVIWAQSSCRSTMGLYEELSRQLQVPVVIALWHYTMNASDIRTVVGLDANEFAHIPTVGVGENWQRGIEILDSHQGYAHLFAVYQGSKVWRRLACEAKRRGETVIIGSEAPCNMASGIKHLLKEIYMRFVLPFKVRQVVRAADRFVNYSGDDDKYAHIIGWEQRKIIPFGYFPPPLQHSHLRIRTGNKPFTILSTGILSRYRGADVLVEALRILSLRGVEYRAMITQNGELLNSLRQKAKRYSLPIEFPGFIPMEDLIGQYETCSVYVGSGRHEPWGMRLNDALNCGAPLVVSTGMGGVKMVRDYGCGLEFANGNAQALADALELLAKDENVYKRCAQNVMGAVDGCSPHQRAKSLVALMGMC